MEIAHTSQLFRKNFFVFLLYCSASLILVKLYIFYPGFDHYEKAKFSEMINGTAYKPYVLRTLMPLMINSLSSLFPEKLKTRTNNLLHRSDTIRKLGWNKNYLFEYLIFLIITFIVFLLHFYVLKKLVIVFYEGCANPELYPLLGLVLIPLFQKYHNYIYDPLTLLLFASALLFLVKQNLIGYYLVFALAIVNKETAVLLIPIFVLKKYNELLTSQLLLSILMQFSLWIISRIILLKLFEGNPGSILEFHLMGHNVNLFTSLPLFLSFLIIFSMITLPIVYRWKQKDRFIKQGLMIVFLPLIISSVFFGFVDEMRGYYEAFPFVFILWIDTFINYSNR